MKSILVRFWVLFLAFGALTACIAPNRNAASTPHPSPVFTVTPAQPWQSFEPARMALAQQLGVNPQEVVPVRYESVEFSNSCLDLPKWDEFCTDVIVSGYRVWFETSQGEWTAHLNADGTQFRFVEPAVSE